MKASPFRRAATGFAILLLLVGSYAARSGLSTAENSEDAETFVPQRQGRKLLGAFDWLGALWNAALSVGTTAATSAIQAGFSGGGGGGGGGGGKAPPSGGGGGGGGCSSMGSCCCWDTSKNPCNPKCSGSATSCGSACV